MKKQKKQKPKTKRPLAPHVAVAASKSVARTAPAPRSGRMKTSAIVDLRNAFDFGREAFASRQVQAYRDARAAVAGYSSDDRQALGLLMLPFVLLAVAIGSSRPVLWRPASDAPVDQTVPLAKPAAPAGGGQSVAVFDQAQGPPLTASPPTAVISANQALPAAAALPPLAVTPASTPAQEIARTAPQTKITATPAWPVVAASAPPAAIVQTTAAGPTALVPSTETAVTAVVPIVAAPVPAALVEPVQAPLIAPSAPAGLAGAAAPIELATLTPPVETPPLAPLTAPPAAPATPGDAATNVCVPEKAQTAAASATRLAALSGQAGGGYIDPIAFGMELAASAREQLDDFTVYTDQYRTIAYPNGDVPPFYGVCTDVIIRAYRGLGVDLQALVHQSKLGSGDTNIDHRRVGTLQKYFATFGESIPISEFAEDYWPGDVVSYYRPQNAHSRQHIAIVSDIVGPSGNFMIIHNRGWGPQQEDALFVDQMTGHYRYSAVRRPNAPALKSKVTSTPAPPSSKAVAKTATAAARPGLTSAKPTSQRAIAR